MEDAYEPVGSGRLLADYLLLFGRCLFDCEFYYQRYPEVKKDGCDPLEHYLTEGWRADYWPHAEFDPADYRRSHMRADDDQAPLVHYYREGRRGSAGEKLSFSQATNEALARELNGDPDNWVAPIDLCPCRVAQALRERLDWRPFTQQEVLPMQREA